MLVHRFDVATLGNAERTPQGFLRIPAYLTRVGVLEYRRADGQVVRELRPRDEVFRAQSLATLSAAPVTDLHPTRMVSPDNVRELQIGHVSDHVKADGGRVSAHVTIQEAKAIAAVERGERRELSCGYACRIDETPGVYEGESYDQVQRDIVYNHVAIGPRNWGRAGSDIALRIDSADGCATPDNVFRLDTADALSVAITAPPDDDGGNKMEPVTIRVDGIDVQVVTKQDAQVVERAIATLTEALTARLDAKINERYALIETARRVLPAEYKFDGQSARQIQEAVLTHLDASVELKERTDGYVAARFDGAMSTVSTERITAPPTRTRGARADAREPFVPDWQKPLSFGRDRNDSNVELATSLKHQVKRGGVARDAQGRELPPWRQPLSFNTAAPKYAGLGARPASLGEPSPGVDVPKVSPILR